MTSEVRMMMTMPESAAWIAIIAAVAAAVVSIINSIAIGWGKTEFRQVAAHATEKLDQIHELTNSNMTAVKQQLAAATARIEALELMLKQHDAIRAEPRLP